MNGIKKIIISLFLVFGLMYLYSCSGTGKALKTIEGDPELLYKDGLARYNKRDYSEALKKFEQLKSSFPDNPPFTTLAELRIGDCHFHMKEYVEAISAYEEFKKIHPTHEDIPYVQFQIAMSYFNQMLSPDRDQTFTKKALSNFEYLVKNYPPSIFTEKAKPKIEICKKRLIDHEFYIGNYYFKQGRFEAAAQRFNGILKMYPGGNDEDKTLFFLGKAYIELEQIDKAKEAFLRIVNEYPKSQYYKEAKSFIEKTPLLEKVSIQKAKDVKNKKRLPESDDQNFVVIKYEEESRRPIGPHEDKFAMVEKSPSLPRIDSEVLNLSDEPKDEGRIQAFSESDGLKIEEEKRMFIHEQVATKKEVKEHQEDKGEGSKELGFKESSNPIEITSDRVESYSKENLIIFRGNVTARQRDMVIYADSIQAFILSDGRGIERIVADGNVRIQQGLRMANCDKAVFYNNDQKVILTGNPKIMEMENEISGDEIIFYVERNEIEVKGGDKERGKLKIKLEGKGFGKID